MRLRFPLKPSYLVGVALWFSICLQSATGLFYSEKAYAEDKHCFCEVSFDFYYTHINGGHIIYAHFLYSLHLRVPYSYKAR